MQKASSYIPRDASFSFDSSTYPFLITSCQSEPVLTFQRNEEFDVDSDEDSGEGSITNHSIRTGLYLPNDLTTKPIKPEAKPVDILYSFSDLIYTCNFLKDEKLVRTYFHQLVNEVEKLQAYCSDLKYIGLDQLVLDKNYNLRIVPYFSPKPEHTICDSDNVSTFIAPEVKGELCKDNLSAEIFSLGILLLVFKSGCLPFREGQAVSGHSLSELFLDDPRSFWTIFSNLTLNLYNFSDNLLDLVFAMAKKDPKQRASLSDIRNSKWFNDKVYSDDELKNIVKESL